MTPILCAVLSVTVKVTFHKISDVLYRCPQEAAAKIAKVVMLSSFKLPLVSMKMPKVDSLY